MLDFPSNSTIGNIAGTSVRSSIVVGRRRCVVVSAEADRWAPSGTRVRGIIFLLSLVRRTLLVGRVLHAPGCLPSHGLLVPKPHGQPRRWFAVRDECGPRPETLLAPRAKVLR